MRTLLRHELRGLWRTHRLLVVAAVLFIFGILGPLSIKYLPDILSQMPGMPEGLEGILPEPGIELALDEFVQNLSQFGVILAILVPMGAIVEEKGRGTAGMILSKPVPRAYFLGAKGIAYASVFLIGIVLAGMSGFYYLGVLFEWLPPLSFLVLVGLIFIYLMMFVSITIFTSTLCKSQLAAAGVSFGVLIILSILGILPSISDYLPAAILQWGRALALGQDHQAAWGSLLVVGLVIVVAWLGSWITLRGQEL